MNRSIKRLSSRAMAPCLVVALAAMGCAPNYASSPPGRTEVGVRVSYSDLDGWGAWQFHAQFGDVWYPNVAPDWAPFTYGNWVWTDHGWLWSSYEPYGWLVFHYGSWYYDDVSGWFWVPGSSWSAAPVNWYVYDNYVCWAPIPPRAYSLPSPWESGVSMTWTAVVRDDFLRDNVGRHRVAARPPSSDMRSVMRRSPDAKMFGEAGQSRQRTVPLTREKVTVQKKTFYKVTLPRVEREKVSRYQDTFKPGPRHTRKQEAGVDEKAKDKKGRNRPPL